MPWWMRIRLAGFGAWACWTYDQSTSWQLLFDRSADEHRTASPLLHAGKNLPDQVTGDLKMLIHQISKVCLQAIKPETPFVMDVISKDYTQATTTDWELDKSHWINVIAHLQLTEQQVRLACGSMHQLRMQHNTREACTSAP